MEAIPCERETMHLLLHHEAMSSYHGAVMKQRKLPKGSTRSNF